MCPKLQGEKLFMASALPSTLRDSFALRSLSTSDQVPSCTTTHLLNHQDDIVPAPSSQLQRNGVARPQGTGVQDLLTCLHIWEVLPGHGFDSRIGVDICAEGAVVHVGVGRQRQEN